MTPNLQKKYVRYFEQMAKEHSEIKSFAFFDVDMLVSLYSQGNLPMPCLMLDVLKGTMFEKNFDATFNKVECSFIVLLPVPLEDYQQEADIFDTSYKIGMDIIQRIREEETLGSCSFENLKWENMGPLADNLYGVNFTFFSYHPIPPQNKNVWL